jgi:hypothetical protein
VIKRKVKIPYDRYAAPTPVCQLTTPTLKISITTTEVSDAGRGSAGSLAIGRESVPADGPDYRRTEGGSEELNISAEPE